jgi:hypothetical protein
VPFRLTTRVGAPTFADLPWEDPLAEWVTQRDVYPVAGVHRHVVRFLAYVADFIEGVLAPVRAEELAQ